MTLIVGRNNAGKSTVIEAIRFIGLATARYKTLPYREPPEEFGLSDTQRGVSPSMRDLNFDHINLFHRYGDPPATIDAEFGDLGEITIYIRGSDELFIVIKDPRGQVVGSHPFARALNLPRINILPQVAPVADVETALTPKYVRDSVSSSRASSHFRNQLCLFNDRFPDFKSLCETSWPRLQIQELLSGCGERRDELELYVRDEDFVREIRWMGHGLQVWLQTMWFLARTGPGEIVVLDEPDVYLHADLQRKLIRILKQQERQSLIATHSIEMMSEVPPSDILVVDRGRQKSQFATSLPAVQAVIDRLGGVHNLQLTRLWNSRKALFVEGDDLSLMKIFQDKLFPESSEPFDILPNMSIGGWGGWSYAVGSSMLLENAGGNEIAKYCIFDSDYRSTDEIEARYRKAAEQNIRIHIWRKKEIENYAVAPGVICRYLNDHMRKGAEVTLDQVSQHLDDLCESLKEDIMDQLSEEYIRRVRPKTAAREGNRYAREWLNARWTSLSGKLGTVGGKALISQISSWTQETYGIGLNAHALARAMLPAELDPELRAVITAIENNQQFRLP